MIPLADLFLYLLTDQEWLLEQTVMTEMELIQVMPVYMITMDLHGYKLDQILTGKRQVI